MSKISSGTQPWWRIFIPDYLTDPLWPLSLEAHAIRHLISSGSVLTESAQAYWGHDGYWRSGRRLYCSRLWWHIWKSGLGSLQKSPGLPPKMQRKKCLTKPREAQAVTATSALNWTHGYWSGTENRPHQSLSHWWDATPYKQARSTTSSGNGPVPCQISPTSLLYNKAF